MLSRLKISQWLAESGSWLAWQGLVGLDVSSTMSAKVPLAVLGSRGFARDFIVDENLTDTLLGQKGGDVRDAMEIFDRDVRSVVEDRKTGVITLRITWKNPETAAAWANLLVEKVNARLREKALAEAERKHQISTWGNCCDEYYLPAAVISRVLEAEMQKMLLARGKDEFAFEIVDRAVVPKHKYRPKVAVLWLGRCRSGRGRGALSCAHAAFLSSEAGCAISFSLRMKIGLNELFAAGLRFLAAAQQLRS